MASKMIPVAMMEKMGWDFLPSGPNEFQWMKFDDNGKRLASQCDDVWERDIEECLSSS